MNILQKVLYYSGFIFSYYAFVFISWQKQACKFHRFKFHAFLCSLSISILTTCPAQGTPGVNVDILTIKNNIV